MRASVAALGIAGMLCGAVAGPLAAAETPDLYDANPPPAMARTQPGTIGGSLSGGYRDTSDRHGANARLSLEASAPDYLGIALSAGAPARWWFDPDANLSPVDGIAPYIAARGEVGILKLSLTYTHDIALDRAGHSQSGKRQWEGAAAFPSRYLDDISITPALYLGRIIGPIEGRTSYFGPGIFLKTDLGARWSAVADAAVSYRLYGGGTAASRDGNGLKLESSLSLIRPLAENTEVVLAIAYEQEEPGGATSGEASSYHSAGVALRWRF